MIMTVEGEIRPEALGVVAMTEYTFFALPGWEHDPWIAFNRPQAIDAILASLQEFRQAGGQTLVDAGGLLLGRDANLLRSLSSSSGIHIIASTGFLREDQMPGQFSASWVRKGKGADPQRSYLRQILDVEHLADIFFQELTQGMVVPGMIRTKMKAGILTAGGSWEKLTEAEELSFRAAAIAAKRTGAAVITQGISQARRQMEILIEEGLKPERIIIGNCDDGRHIDLNRDRELAGKGAYVAYDHIGWEDGHISHCLPDERRVELVKAMLDAGLAERVILSCSAIGCTLGLPRPKHDYAHLLKTFVPKLKKAGVGGGAIDAMLRENPKRILTQD